MTTPPPGQDPFNDLPPPPPTSGPPYQPGPPYPPGPAYPVSPYAAPASPYGYAGGGAGVDPVTGQPLSDKSKVVAGLLQLLPGFLFGLGGIGRLYAGHTMLGAIQLGATVIGWISFWCGFLLVFPFLIFAGVWAWFVIDGILLLVGRPTDGQGRLLRTG